MKNILPPTEVLLRSNKPPSFRAKDCSIAGGLLFVKIHLLFISFLFMIDHISLYVEDYDRAKAFYLKALQPLGYELVMEFPQAGGFGVSGKPDFWVVAKGFEAKFNTHISFAAQTRAQVDAFYEAAIAAGGVDNGKPGLRTQYHEHYYGAFVHDPDGNNIDRK